jgi:hypothetical protein
MSGADTDIAARLFPTMATSKPEASTPRTTSPANTLAERMFGNSTRAPATEPTPNPEARAARSEGEIAESMFDGSKSHGDAERVIERGLIESDLEDPAIAAGFAKEWTPIFMEFKVNATESKALADIGIQAHANPPDETKLAQWVGDAKQMLKQDFGDSAGQALADGMTLVAKNPELSRYLQETGLGNHPLVVKTVCAKARALRAAGKL